MQVMAGSTAQAETLQQAILIYQTFASVHEVSVTPGKQAQIKPGVLATKGGLMAALRSLLPESERGSGLLPVSMLAQGVDHMVWWIPPAKRSVWFKSEDVGGERTAVVPHPGLVMVVCEKGWHIFAVKGKERPTPDTPLFQVPYYNVWAGGKICTGSAQVPRGKAKKQTACWEDAFFRSYFSHSNIRYPARLVAKGKPETFWKKMLDGAYARFPEGMLVSTKETLQSAYDRLIRRI